MMRTMDMIACWEMFWNGMQALKINGNNLDVERKL